MNKTLTAITLLTLGVAILAPVSTEAAERKVCFTLKIVDDRSNCSTSSEDGAVRPCQELGSYVYPVGHKYELWDKDYSEGNEDEKIGTWIVGGSGSRCVTFEWEDESYSKGESDPDIYMKYINEVRGTSGGVTVTAVDTDGSSHAKTSWRSCSSSDSDRCVAKNCAAGSTCWMFPSGSLVPTKDASTERADRIMALDSAQHALEIFGGIMSSDVDMHYPGKSSCSTSCAVSRTEIHIASSRGDNGFNVAHELGHVIQMQEFNQDYLRNDCSAGGSGHSISSSTVENESCATAEGWADYVGVVSWYEPNNTSTVPVAWGMDVEAATPMRSTCSDNGGLELQVARAFWDLDDWNNESGVSPAYGLDDNDSYGTTWIAEGWDQFGDGTGNRNDYESGVDGVNVKDYYYNNTTRFTSSTFYETLINHNCLYKQDYY